MEELRLCAGCNRNYLTWPTRGDFFCAQCTKRRHDAEPPIVVGSIVKYRVRYKTLDRVRFVVLAREGDILTIRRLGFPAENSIQTSVHAVLTT